MNNKGFVLVTSLLLIVLITILSMAAMSMTITDLKIAQSDRSIKQTLMLAEGGIEEGRGRLQDTPLNLNRIVDNQPTNPNWTVFIGDESKSQGKGFDSGKSNHSRIDKVTIMDYVVSIRHKINSSKQVLYWGDVNNDGLPEENPTAGVNIYVITSEGFNSQNASKSVQIEAAAFPPVPIPAALYAEDFVTINGSSTTITGIDQCGGLSIPGVMTRYDINILGQPEIYGNPDKLPRSATDYDVTGLINSLKAYANITPAPAQYNDVNWGNLQTNGTSQVPLPNTCTDRNIVYVKGNLSLKSQGNQGCGILLVDGDLMVDGGFKWYGPIIVSGIIDFKGGGQRNITGAIVSGGTSVTVNDEFGGNSVLFYCSSAIQFQTQGRPLQMLRWSADGQTDGQKSFINLINPEL